MKVRMRDGTVREVDLPDIPELDPNDIAPQDIAKVLDAAARHLRVLEADRAEAQRKLEAHIAGTRQIRMSSIGLSFSDDGNIGGKP